MDDTQRLYDIIAILVSKLGGEVVITDKELEKPPVGTVTRYHATGEMKITTE